MKTYIAIDLGASSGRVMLGKVDENAIVLEEIHRFKNGPVTIDNSLRWDFTRMFNEIKLGVKKAIHSSDKPISSIGVDSWGVDFGLLDIHGNLVENPFHYRDSRTETIIESAFALMDRRTIYENSGTQFMPINTIYQLLAAKNAKSDSLQNAKHLVFFADLVSYHLCGEVFSEYTLASTSQLLDMHTGQWSKAIFEKLQLPIDLMPRIVAAGTVVGKLTDSLCAELSCDPIEVIAVGSHDTASAVAAVPCRNANWAFLSSGTWSLMGLEVPKAIINDPSYRHDLTNEGGVDNTIRLLKNVMGLWLVQECRQQWKREGKDLSHGELVSLAQKAQPFEARINPDDLSFLAPGDMPKRINTFLIQSGQSPLSDIGHITRAILESLAMAYRLTMEKLEKVTGRKIDVLHIVSGGIQNELLCQLGANAIGRKIIAGPAEATAMGNILMQAKANGQIKSLADGRALVRQSIESKEYDPCDTALWNAEYLKSKQLLNL